MLSNKEEAEVACIRAGKKSGDLVHPLPYAPDLHFADLKSSVADMKNSNLGKMEGPPSAVAGLFIASHVDFSDDIDWIHVDIGTQQRVSTFCLTETFQLLQLRVGSVPPASAHRW